MAEKPKEINTARPPSPPTSVRLLEMSERLANEAKKNGWSTSDRFTGAHNTDSNPIPKEVESGGKYVLLGGKRIDLKG
jgi:hypothetical protein